MLEDWQQRIYNDFARIVQAELHRQEASDQEQTTEVEV